MIRVCRERNDKRGQEFWSYVLLVVDMLKTDGMSDEEDGTAAVNFGGFVRDHAVKKVLHLYWRHPWFRDLFEIVDSAPAVERLIFHRAGGPRMPRIRTDDISKRPPPTGLPEAFYRPEYLDGMLTVDREDLRISDAQVPVYNFVGFDPNMVVSSGGSEASSSTWWCTYRRIS